MANPASVTDIEARWQPLTGQLANNAQAFLDDAWVILKRRIPTLEAGVVTDPDLAADVVRIECQMVLRVLKNPDGKSQESIDDYSWTRGKAIADGSLYLSDTELSDLLGNDSAGAFTIRPVATPFCSPLQSTLPAYVDDYGLYGDRFDGLIAE